MKAPPLVAAPFVRGRRNRPIDSRIPRRRHDSARTDCHVRYRRRLVLLVTQVPPPNPPFAIDRIPTTVSRALGKQAVQDVCLLRLLPLCKLPVSKIAVAAIRGFEGTCLTDVENVETNV